MLGICAAVGCASPQAPLDLSSMDPLQDQWAIATHHAQEASRLRQKAEELSARITVYEHLFGSDSDWVSGSRLLLDTYEEAAREQDRLASQHLNLVTERRFPGAAGAPTR